MSGRFLLDTNVVIALFKKDAPVQKNLAGAEKVFVPATVLGELYCGAHKSGQAEKKQIEEFMGSVPVPACDVGTAREYGLIKYLRDRPRSLGRGG